MTILDTIPRKVRRFPQEKPYRFFVRLCCSKGDVRELDSSWQCCRRSLVIRIGDIQTCTRPVYWFWTSHQESQCIAILLYSRHLYLLRVLIRGAAKHMSRYLFIRTRLCLGGGCCRRHP